MYNIVKANVRYKLMGCNFLVEQCFLINKANSLWAHSVNKYTYAISTKPVIQRHFSTKEQPIFLFEQSKSDIFNKQDTLVELDNPDTFGLIGRSNSILTETSYEDEGDKREDEYISQLPSLKQKLPSQKYIDMIKIHVANKRINEAIEVLEVRMLKEDRVKPEPFIYNLLIGSCAQVGYTKKAFKLYNDMKRRGLKVSGGVYTSLFNACANSPWKEDGIERATHLRRLMTEKGIPLNITMYNCMIKAYGRCGDTKTAFQIVDEMIALKIPLRTHTFNFLLQACISDKQSGFRSALITWRKMLSLKEKPNIYSFRLMLRAVAECGFGDNENNNEIIKDLLKIAPYKHARLMLNEKNPEILNILENSSENNCETNTIVQRKTSGVIFNTLPNFLERFPEMKGTVGFGEVKTASDRFMMIGGSKGIFREMLLYHVSPDIKFVTQLLELMPSTLEDENNLMSLMKEMKIKTDINFYNMLMKKRCFRKDYNSAKDILKLIKKENKLRTRSPFVKRKKLINLDIITYGVLAMCCDTKESAVDYIQELKSKYTRINCQIVGALLKQATFHNDFEYISYVMKIVDEENIQVNSQFTNHLQKHMQICKRAVSQNSTSFTNVENCKKYLERYGKWMKMLNKKIQVEPDHPWEQFVERQPETLQRFKDHIAFKKRIYKTYRRVTKYQVKL